MRDSVRNGAQLLAVPANNANFNQTMSEQQLAFSKLRAVELDRYALVASNVGISALVTPDGRELVRTNFFTPAYLDNQVRLKMTLTPAARWGPILQGGLGRGRCRDPARGDAAQWMVRRSPPAAVGAGK